MATPQSAPDNACRIRVDAVVATPPARALATPLAGPRVVASDPWATSAWSFAAEAFLESPAYRLGSRMACADPHALELGALGVAAFHRTPAALMALARGDELVTARPRRATVHLNDPLPSTLDAADVALHLVEMVGPHGLSDAVLEVTGEGLTHLPTPARRRLLGACAATGALTAVVPVEDAPAQAWTRGGGLPLLDGLRSDAGAPVDELLVINARDVASRFLTADGRVVAADELRLPNPMRVLVGGCTAGDASSIQDAIERFEHRPPSRDVPTFLIPASAHVLEGLRSTGWVDRAQRAGCPVLPPHQVPARPGTTLATSTCLAPDAITASIPSLVATANQSTPTPGRL